jgi:hypothetical protein
MNIYAGFSTIPFIGQILGIAGAAAAIAFGAEQIGNITAAAQGGLITGGISGMDSVPALLMPGEVVTPAKNYEELVGSVYAARAAQNMGLTQDDSSSSDTQGGNNAQTATVVLQFNDDFGKVVEATIAKRQRMGISILKKVT